MKQKEPILTREFALLFAISVAVCLGMNMLNVVIPLYVTGTLGSTVAMSGYLSTTYTLASCLSRPVFSRLSDRWGRKPVLLMGCGLFAIACVFCGAINLLAAAFLCRIFMGIGYSAASTADNSASTDVIPANRMGEGIGYFGMSQSLATAAGPAVASFAVAGIGTIYALYLVGLVVSFGLLRSLLTKNRGPVQPQQTDRTARESAFERASVKPALFEGLTLFLVSCLMCFMTLYIVGRGYSSQVAGIFFLISSGVIVAVRLLLSRFTEQWDLRCFLLPSYGLLAITALLLPYANSPGAFYGLSVLYGAAHGISWMALGSDAVKRAPAHRRGAANATFFFAFDAAIGIGATVWGTLIDCIGYLWCFRLVAVGSLLLAVAALLFCTNNRR
jgi:MFS family permease